MRRRPAPDRRPTGTAPGWHWVGEAATGDPRLRSVSRVSEHNAQVIEEFRARGGVTERYGADLLLVHTVGHRTGRERVHPVRTVVIDGAWHVAGSAAGRPDDPVWAVNLRRRPETVVEAPEGEVGVRARLLEGEERASAWAAFTAAAPAFLDYQAKADAHGRTIPLFRLERTGG